MKGLVGTMLTLGVVAAVGARSGAMIPNHPNCTAPNRPIPVYFVHPTNCSKFYECRQQDAYEFDCPAGLHFNSKIDVCDYPENAQCAPSTTTTGSPIQTDPPTPAPTSEGPSTNPSTNPPGSTSTTARPPVVTEEPSPSPTTEQPTTAASTELPSPTTEEPPVTDPPTSNPTPEATSTPDKSSTEFPAVTTPTPPVDPHCPQFGAEKPSYWADPMDCTKYLGCSEGCVQQFKCPTNLYWNDKQKRCDYHWNCQCTCPVIPPAPSVLSDSIGDDSGTVPPLLKKWNVNS
ncbi:platelet glycoprotein Ib alpha chain-like [Anopheles bellator]|uniref:platelet glycoprotein Ib alpha chain-like n=1 Tax=Anopheles bellator TaxID=139047 RepID=UPI002649597B|nr:platelet glycoprotein Ib alpha chain-like [Anopheles bellator]